MEAYKKGFAVGTFDLFHIGHLNLLKQAKMSCEYLVVGVHSDEWVLQCKNHLPVIPYRERAEIVAAVRYVDEVIKNERFSKLEAWHRLHFDVAFIGADWKGTEVWNHIEEELREVGCDVIYLPYTQGISTSELRRRLRNSFSEQFVEKQV